MFSHSLEKIKNTGRRIAEGTGDSLHNIGSNIGSSLEHMKKSAENLTENLKDSLKEKMHLEKKEEQPEVIISQMSHIPKMELEVKKDDSINKQNLLLITMFNDYFYYETIGPNGYYHEGEIYSKDIEYTISINTTVEELKSNLKVLENIMRFVQAKNHFPRHETFEERYEEHTEKNPQLKKMKDAANKIIMENTLRERQSPRDLPKPDSSAVATTTNVITNNDKQVEAACKTEIEILPDVHLFLMDEDKKSEDDKKIEENNKESISEENQEMEKNEFGGADQSDEVSLEIKMAEDAKNKFASFLNAYVISVIDSKSGCWGMFSRHGEEGKGRADNFSLLFNGRKEDMTSITDTQEILKALIFQEKDKLAGNFKEGSLKTCLVAYYKYLEEVKSGQIAEIEASTYIHQYEESVKKLPVDFEEYVEAQYNELFLKNKLQKDFRLG